MSTGMTIEMPEHVDSLSQILWWEADEFGVAIGCLGIGIIFHHMMGGFIAAFLIGPYIKRLKSDELRGSSFHVACSSGLVKFNDEYKDLMEKDFYI
jgi:type IV conjugative transfer system protein TraL